MNKSDKASHVSELCEDDVRWVALGPSDLRLSELEALGMVSWLWQQSPLNKVWPIALMRRLVEPALHHGQYALAVHHNGTPLLYTSWALLDEDRERKILAGAGSLCEAEWVSGEHIWAVDWIAPMGGMTHFYKKLSTELFAGKVGWALRVRPDRQSGWIQQFRGAGVSRAARRTHWLRLERNLSRLDRRPILEGV